MSFLISINQRFHPDGVPLYKNDIEPAVNYLSPDCKIERESCVRIEISTALFEVIGRMNDCGKIAACWIGQSRVVGAIK
ncbi:hypothetical protein SAMN05428977_100620 [Nitrosomonas sp. Nm166]|nr:hypothetical protein SAMN05428977_100620 [Nitrosomonas sp. Nm166]